MMTGSDMECDSISAKTLTASSVDSASDKGDSSRSSLLEAGDSSSAGGVAYQPSIFIRIFVAEFNIQKCLQFPPTTPIWEVKQRLFATLPKELKDSANFGLFCPPFNGRAGKFLDDERELKDYPMPGHVGYLELKYKRRVYKMMNLDEKMLKQLHTKANLRKFIDYVLSGQCEKITKLCNKGLDPNFHDLDNGETPLTLATTLKEPVPVLVALINGGAHLDFRALDGCTPLHRAAQQNNFKSLQGLLELGSSANYKDSKGLTPLYYSVTHCNNPSLCELLLHNYALSGAVDSQGSQEIHQVCRNGLVRHLEHLLFYGADIDARNASGNTPLHVCAVNNQESCARVLLFRGADKHAKNYANQTAYHVAVIAGATILADVIKTHLSKDIVPLREKPSYNPRRRRRSQSPSSSSTISRTNSVSRLSSRSPSISHVLASPSPSTRSYAMFSASGSVSSNGSNCENNSQPSDDQCSTSGVVTDKSSCSDDSTCTPSMVHLPHLPPSNSSGTVGGGGSHRMSRPQQRMEPMRNDRMSVYSRSDVASVKSVPVRRADSAFFTDSAPQSREVSIERHRVGVPRTVTLARGSQGFGFVLRGSKHGNMVGTQGATGENPPALQYLDEVDRGGPADLAGLKPGDFLLSISGEDVRAYPHERAVNLIRVAQHAVTLTVLTCPSVSVRCSGYSGSVSRPPLKVPPPPRRDPRTSLTIGPERSRSYVGLNDIGSSAYDTVGTEAKIASIRARPSSRRITAVEIEELIERTNQGPVTPSPSLSSFQPLPKTDSTPNGTTSRVFSSVAQMKRQRAQLQQRRQTEVVNTAALHKDYFSTPDLSVEGEEEEEEVYSDTMYRPGDVYQHSVPSQQVQRQQNGYQDPRREVNHRSVPTTPQHGGGGAGYARPVFSSAEKPPLPPNRPPQPHQHPQAPHPHHNTVSSKPQSERPALTQQGTMRPSYSLDERTYTHMTTAAHVHEAPAYAAPEDPEPDYFSDEDRVSYSSSGRGASVTSSVPSTPVQPGTVKAQTATSRPPVQRMMSQPPPPPPPPVTSGATGPSFADAIAKAAQARQAKAHLPHVTSAPAFSTPAKPGTGGSRTGGNSNGIGVTGGNGTIGNGIAGNGTGGGNVTAVTRPLAPATVAPPPAPQQNDFQSELMRAIQRRSVEKEPSDSRRSSSTDVDAVGTATTATATATSSVKDRIIFLERQRAVPGALKAVRLSGITTDQSSTDADGDLCETGVTSSGVAVARSGAQVSLAGRNANSGSTVTLRAGVHHTAKSGPCQSASILSGGGGGSGSGGSAEIDEGTPVRFAIHQYRSTGNGGGGGTGGGGSGSVYLRDHDSASINSQSSASTLSSGYESPTLKYGSAGEHLWSSIPHTEVLPSRKFMPGCEPVGNGIAPPPEFS